MGQNRQEADRRFPEDIANHKIHIIRDDGVHRHVRFKRPESGSMYFDLITWPGCLCYTGDMGTYVFQRLHDMFEFFGTDGGRINPGYWSEKVIAADRHGKVEEFNEEEFRRVVIREFMVPWVRSEPDKDVRRELWDQVIYEVLGEDGRDMQTAAYRFKFQGTERTFRFDDIFEYSCREHTFSFLWCCHALAWGIAKYDEHKLSLEQHHGGEIQQVAEDSAGGSNPQ